MDPVIKKAEERLEWLSSDEETLRLYEAREFSRYERNSIIADAKEEGRKEIARKLLALGVELQKIAEATGLSEEEIKKL
jgi:predicted transposase/invertase (TIGR01784 family)